MNTIELICRGESETLEFKESFSLRDEIGAAISAFSNTKGGVVLIGVTDVGGVKGIDVGANTIENEAGYIKRHTDPPIFPFIKVFEVDGKNVVAIEVEESSDKPIFVKKYAHKRVGKSNHRMLSSEMRRLAHEDKPKLLWDERICEDAGLEDIDEEKVRWFLEKARFERRLEVSYDTPIIDALERLNLIKKNNLTDAAILLFGKRPQKFFLQSKVRCARYKGTTPVDFIDLRVIEGTIVDQVDDAEKFILSHIKKAAKIVGFKRVEALEYPLNALREAIVNAICHRDYASSGDITIGIFDDRIEISNPGTLPEPLMPVDLKHKHMSIPRNPLVANAFFMIRNVEQWGEGTNKIVQWCTEYGLREPDFENIAGGFLVSFYAPDDILSLIPESGKINLEELGLNERQIKGIELIFKNGRITNSEYAREFNISRNSATNDLTSFIEKGLIKRIGKGRGCNYVPKI
ncbi:MAG: helix-turn-helix domain-containing protein [ANME-2 cluster archaeon]|nr:helix-turn-helix domain-containing protein [ANME-2 cluster archaeon]